MKTTEDMTENNQMKLGKMLWSIADQLRGAMNADDFRDYMLAFLFLRYLSDNYERLAKLDTLRTHKQGVMQQLFPSLEHNEQ